MKCHKCSKDAKHKLIDKEYCAGCYCKLVEQKIRRHLREYKMKRGVRLRIKDSSCLFVIEKVINIPYEQVKTKWDYDVSPITMDDINEEFLNEMIGSKKSRNSDYVKIIKLFYPLSRKDMKQYFKLKKINFDYKETEMSKLIDKLEKKHPGSKSSLLKSSEKLQEIN